MRFNKLAFYLRIINDMEIEGKFISGVVYNLSFYMQRFNISINISLLIER